MYHDSSQFNSISRVIGGSVTMTENHVACEYSRPHIGRRRGRESAPRPLGGLEEARALPQPVLRCQSEAKGDRAASDCLISSWEEKKVQFKTTCLWKNTLGLVQSVPCPWLERTGFGKFDTV